MDLYEQPTQPDRRSESQGASPSSTRGMSRRKALGLGAASLVGIGAVGAGGVALERWWQERHGQQGAIGGDIKIGHLLRKAGFGASASEIQSYAGLGFEGAIDRLLNYQQVSEEATERRLSQLQLDMSKPAEMQQWWLMRMAWTQRPLLEKMTLFWHGVLVSSYRKVGGKNGYERMIVQNKFLREHAFDTYDNILLGITADPAMQVYLDLNKSTSQHPNENYARELMELFTLGLGNYSQQDVFNGAAALTGWRLSKQDPLKSTYVPSAHTNLQTTFLGHTGKLDYKNIVDILANHPALPWFICRKLFTFFVYENPSKDDLQPLVDAYNQSKHNMGAVMKALLHSPQFSSAQAYRSRLKSPVEFTIGAYRALEMQGTGKALPAITLNMGQEIFNPPNVAGWPGDKVSTAWLNSGTWMTRLNYINAFLQGQEGAKKRVLQGQQQPLDFQHIVDSQKISSPEQFVTYFANFLLDGNLPAERKTVLVDYLTTRDTSRGASVKFGNGTSYPLNRVRGTLYLLMTLPEYQLN
ncbi:DUF1800 domain-containing protein [Ktedonobacter robiniae]|uniref:DUF1800 domain-containing protein n=1 Tax=Ktedonobacter robiniae TaxID=2778365 RepID=A0ABQ3UPX8_9CHLR|nr:DUF1800 domain-containing protein [Ktedonobacter robiniae]GHO54735.1 hypothetical protein KSB_32100 [Ktedonobacter robiniae]